MVAEKPDFSLSSTWINLDWLTPDLRQYWQIGRSKKTGQFVMLTDDRQLAHIVNEFEAFALSRCTGKQTLRRLQSQCQRQFGDRLPADFLPTLFHKLQSLNIIADPDADIAAPVDTSVSSQSLLKPGVTLIDHPDGYCLVRNPENMQYLQVDMLSKDVITRLGTASPQDICRDLQFPAAQFQELMKLLTVAGMLAGVDPPQPKPKKWTPLQLLYYKRSLINPDRALTAPAQWLRWIWTAPVFWALLGFMGFSLVWGLHDSAELITTGNLLWQTRGPVLIVPFVLLSMVVVTIHELGHALTLKHYGGEVQDMGLLFMCLIPAAYTNSTDSYQLKKKRQRVLVVAAGIICQCVIGAVALWLWHFSAVNSWLKPTSYLLLAASLFTLVVNLNPMARFDGYHLLVAMTGINSLKDRSFKFYRSLFSRQPQTESARDQWILAIYAPLSLLYICFVFGSLLRFVVIWTLDHAAVVVAFFIIAWLIYYFFPEIPHRSHDTAPSKS
ncbi:M50 family metallopeptidase [Spirulina major CS-329]|uniref:site-2 protease family protein n=1 Tax=Spirulina TaxID=1154 RepID=UPI00232BD297|nr:MULTISPECIES: site-2 protease family protein [Spirulina]MDB9494560.1 M50 family metallopeptidase [Spirulina subsalsa CS-330]MDB9503998.1 M50 family metallopeptidase [Spirulina major CS-329]